MNKINEQQMVQLLLNLEDKTFLDTEDKQQVDAFIEKNGVDAVDRDGRTFLLSAAAKTNFPLVSYLIEQSYNLDASDKQGKTALHIVAIHDFYEIAQLLIEHGAEIDLVDAWGNTPIWRAAMNSQQENSSTAELLLAKGADRNKKNDSGIAPIDLLIS